MPMDCGFAVLCPVPTTAQLSLQSIKQYYPDAPLVCVVPNTTDKKATERLAQYCPVRKGKTYAEMLNEGMKHAGPEWLFLIKGGNWVQPFIDRRVSLFINGSKDILYGMTRRTWEFVDNPLHFLLLHHSAYKAIGDFETTDFLLDKAAWASRAIEQGYTLKGIAGLYI
jgi:hypothetical protein